MLGKDSRPSRYEAGKRILVQNNKMSKHSNQQGKENSLTLGACNDSNNHKLPLFTISLVCPIYVTVMKYGFCNV